MAKPRIQQTIRKSVDGILDFSNGNINIEVEDIGVVSFANVFRKFDGEHVKVVVTVSNDESEVMDSEEPQGGE
jgi:chemotaxis protein CheY-P-specific phosphatase CheC